MPGGDFVFRAQSASQGGGKGLASGGQPNECELVLAVPEYGVGCFESLPEKLDFKGAQFPMTVVDGFGGPKAGELEGNLAAGLLPQKDIGGARSKPQKALGAVQTGASWL